MRRTGMTCKIAASLLAVAVWNLCSFAAVARELGSAGSLGELLEPQAPLSRTTLRPAPRAVSGEVGQVSWARLPRVVPAWNCRTGDGSGVTINLDSAGKVALAERSNMNVRTSEDAVVVTLLEGAVTLEGAAGARVETFDGVYRLDPSATGSVRFAWRDGVLATSGDGIRKETGSGAQIFDAGIVLQPVETSAAQRGGRATLAVRVTDATGRPVAGAPVIFAPASGGSPVALSGQPTRRVLTRADGVAEVTAAARTGSAAVVATISGIPASAVVAADAGQTTGGQKVFAWILLGAVAVITAILVADAVGDDDPKLQAGTPTLVR